MIRKSEDLSKNICSRDGLPLGQQDEPPVEMLGLWIIRREQGFPESIYFGSGFFMPGES